MMPNPVRALLDLVFSIARQRAGLVGLVLIGLHLAVMLFAPLLATHAFAAQDGASLFSGPSLAHWLGTDHLGRDVYSRLLSGGVISFRVTAIATVIAVCLGSLLGMAAGYFGGWFDEVMMRVTDAFQSVPWLPFMMLMVTILGNSSVVLISVLAFCYSLPISRVARTATMDVAVKDFVTAAKARGEGAFSIMRHEIWPNVRAVVLVDGAMQWSWMLLWFSSLSFLGLGVSPPNPDWGLMISDVRLYLPVIPIAAIAPMLALSSLIIAINLLADAAGKAVGVNPDRYREVKP